MENMIIGLSTSFIGMAIVFSVLILLALILSAFKSIFSEEKVNTVVPPPSKDGDNTVKNNPSLSAGQKPKNDSELIAVITAAAAYAMGTTTDKIAVRSVRKISASGWNEAALRESMK